MAVTQPRGRAAAASNGTRPNQFTLDLPMLTIQIRRPELRMPHVEMPHVEMPRVPMPHIGKQEIGHYVDVARTFIPPPERVAYYGALGALAVFGVVDWPVAAAIGAGTIIAQRGRRQASFPSMRPRQTAAPPQESAPSRRATTSTRRRATETSGATGGRKTATTSGAASARKTATTSRATTSGRTTTTSGRRKSTTQSG
jgi:hypothetical protein